MLWLFIFLFSTLEYFLKFLFQKLYFHSIFFMNTVSSQVSLGLLNWVLWVLHTSLVGFPGGSVVENPSANAGDIGSIPDLERAPGEGNGYLLQYSCLGNPVDRGAWRAKSGESQKSWTHIDSTTTSSTFPWVYVFELFLFFLFSLRVCWPLTVFAHLWGEEQTPLIGSLYVGFLAISLHLKERAECCTSFTHRLHLGEVGWMTSLTQCTWVWVNSRSWWWTGKPGVLQSMGLQRVGHDWVTELNQTSFSVCEWGAVGKIGMTLLWDANSTVKCYPLPERTFQFLLIFLDSAWGKILGSPTLEKPNPWGAHFSLSFLAAPPSPWGSSC